jgi:ABC-type amino acid transport substrate-binding protein
VDTPDGPISDMMAGKLVGAQRESTNLELAELLADGGLFKVEPYKNTESLKNALRRSRIDLAVADTSFAYSAQLDTRKNGVDLLKFKEFRPEDMPPSLKDQNMQYYTVAVRKGEIQLLGAINETIAKAKQDGALTTLFNAATEEYEKANGYDPGSRSLGERPWECSNGIVGGN